MEVEIKNRAKKSAQSIYEVLQATPSNDQAKKVTDILERLTIEIVLEERERLAGVAQACCSPDDDMAHKIAREIRRDSDLLIANLSALR